MSTIHEFIPTQKHTPRTFSHKRVRPSFNKRVVPIVNVKPNGIASPKGLSVSNQNNSLNAISKSPKAKSDVSRYLPSPRYLAVPSESLGNFENESSERRNMSKNNNEGINASIAQSISKVSKSLKLHNLNSSIDCGRISKKPSHHHYPYAFAKPKGSTSPITKALSKIEELPKGSNFSSLPFRKQPLGNEDVHQFIMTVAQSSMRPKGSIPASLTPQDSSGIQKLRKKEPHTPVGMNCNMVLPAPYLESINRSKSVKASFISPVIVRSTGPSEEVFSLTNFTSLRKMPNRKTALMSKRRKGSPRAQTSTSTSSSISSSSSKISPSKSPNKSPNGSPLKKGSITEPVDTKWVVMPSQQPSSPLPILTLQPPRFSSPIIQRQQAPYRHLNSNNNNNNNNNNNSSGKSQSPIVSTSFLPDLKTSSVMLPQPKKGRKSRKNKSPRANRPFTAVSVSSLSGWDNQTES